MLISELAKMDPKPGNWPNWLPVTHEAMDRADHELDVTLSSDGGLYVYLCAFGRKVTPQSMQFLRGRAAKVLYRVGMPHAASGYALDCLCYSFLKHYLSYVHGRVET